MGVWGSNGGRGCDLFLENKFDRVFGFLVSGLSRIGEYFAEVGGFPSFV